MGEAEEMESQTFIIMGIPRGQDRARAFVPKGHARAIMVDTKENRDNSKNIRAQVLQQNPKYIAEGPIALTLVFWFPRPKSHYTKKGLRPDAPSLKSSTPDLDNCVKAQKDALKGIVWKDDAQVSWLFARKVYTEDPPKTEIKVEVAG